MKLWDHIGPLWLLQHFKICCSKSLRQIASLVAGHWKLSHTTKNFVLQQGILLANLGLFTFARNSPRLFDSFGFTEAKPAFIAFTLFQLISSPIDEVTPLPDQ